MTADPNRREFLNLGMGLFVALSLPLAFRRRTILTRRTLPLMGTIAELQVAHHDQQLAEDAIDAALAELLWVERTMTRFRPDSDIGRANLGAAREAVLVAPATAAVIQAALRWAEATEGRFDPALGAASKLWDVLNRKVPPPPAPVRRLAGRGFWRRVDVDWSRGTPAVRFNDPEVQLDLGGIAKGYGYTRPWAMDQHREQFTLVNGRFDVLGYERHLRTVKTDQGKYDALNQQLGQKTGQLELKLAQLKTGLQTDVT